MKAKKKILKLAKALYMDRLYNMGGPIPTRGDYAAARLAALRGAVAFYGDVFGDEVDAELVQILNEDTRLKNEAKRTGKVNS